MTNSKKNTELIYKYIEKNDIYLHYIIKDFLKKIHVIECSIRNDVINKLSEEDIKIDANIISSINKDFEHKIEEILKEGFKDATKRL